MRGKGASTPCCTPGCRITPAYAGKSDFTSDFLTLFWDHPRVCGEKHSFALHDLHHTGSPPRMRGKAKLTDTGIDAAGITPAYAGKRIHWN